MSLLSGSMGKSANSYLSYISLTLFMAMVLSGCAGNGQLLQSSSSGPVEYQLIAEIALQRGQYQVAVQEYLSLAQQSANPEHARRATELAYDYGYDAYALASAQRWVELVPENTDAHAYLGRMYVRRNLLAEAWGSLDISLGPIEQRVDMDYMMLSGELVDSVAASRVLTVFQYFDAAYPDTPGIKASLAGLAAQAGELELAVVAARETLTLAPDWAIVRIWLSRFLLLAGDRVSAFEQMAFALEITPGLEMELEFVELLAMAGEGREALQRLERLSTRYPKSPDLVRIRGALALQLSDFDTAQSDFSYLLSEAYFVNESFWHLGQLAFMQGNYLQAIRYFQRVNSGSWFFPARTAISQAYLELGDGETALAVQYEFANEYPRQAVASLQPQADILVEMGRLPDALEIINSALEYKPWDEGLWLYRGGLLEQLGKLDASVESFRRASELAPDSALTLNALGYTLSIAGEDYDEAYTYIQRALDKEPNNPAIMDSMGWVLYLQGKPDEALSWLRQAYALMPDPVIAAHLGEVLWVGDERDEAIQIWTDALLKDPDSQVLNETTSRFMQ
ncbi:MAG: tetratricopeptide repeat protein [Gammaproteobacteria bacterium]|nr:tetratricopeptide repeat protein [Gammaproteobacteria bacterium]MCP4276248.1 tetratricopeptide repeat protein [Gammaproteobacteria bacterium]